MNNPHRNRADNLCQDLLKHVNQSGGNNGSITLAVIALVYAVLSHHKDRD